MASKAKDTTETDLFGAPIDQITERWGRPKYKKNKENCAYVEMMVATGFSQEVIAQSVGCDPKTLRKHFSRELQTGNLSYKTKLMQVLHQNAMKGNNAAAKTLLGMVEAAEDKAFTPGKRNQPVNPEAEGKKERLRHEAQKPLGEWSEILPGGESIQ